MKLKVIYTDGTEVEALSGPRAQVAVERKYDCMYIDIYDNSTGKARVERFYFEAWAALHYSGHETAQLEFEEWLNTIVDVAPVGDKVTRPTKRARRPGNSSSSPS